MRKLGVAVFLWIICLGAIAASPSNFSRAKDLALSIFNQHPVTLYCACHYSQSKKVDLVGCQMHQAQPISRANRIEWEHMMPAYQFGHGYECWQKDVCINNKTNKPYHGRKCCERVSAKFRRVEAELYNLWPAVGAVNQARSNYPYGELVNKRGFYGCSFDVDSSHQIAEPPDIAKGVVARANLLMSWRYGITLKQNYRRLIERWNRDFPPTLWEKQWALSVESIVQYPNPFITFYGDTKGLNDFLSKHGSSKA